MTCVFIVAEGTSVSCWRQNFFQFQQRPAFLPHCLVLCCHLAVASCLGLLISITIFLSQAHLPQCASSTSSLLFLIPAPFLGVYQHSHFSLMGNPGTHPCEAIHYLQGSFETYRHDCHTEQLCCPSYMGVNADATQGTPVALPLCAILAQDASGPWLHCGHAGHLVPG